MNFKIVAKSLLFSLPLSGVVLAQQKTSPVEPSPPPPRQITEPPQSTVNLPPPNVGELMRQNNGSLFRAAEAMPNDPRLVKASEVNMFAVPAPKPKTMQKHDLVTIVVREETEFSSEGSTDAKKDASFDAKLEQVPKINLSNFAFQNAVGSVVPELKLSGSRDYKNEGNVDRKDSLTARVQAEVVDVKPNGTLVLQARKRILTDEEEQLFVLTGVCRVQDITADNSVLSTQMFDLDVRKTHSGAVRDATKRGWVPRVIDWINPF